jgi:hypothetical protein
MEKNNTITQKEQHTLSEEIKELNDIELEKISKSNKFDKFYYFINNLLTFLLNSCIILFKISGMYILWICLHYFSSHLYIKFCVPYTIVGFIMSPFMISTPHCQGLRWIVYNAANTINHMWILIGAWIYSVIWIMGTNQTLEK